MVRLRWVATSRWGIRGGLCDGDRLAVFIARRWSLGDSISSEDVVDEELEEQKHAEDETVAAAQGLALLRRLVPGDLTTQCAQVSEDTGISVINIRYRIFLCHQ